MIIYIDVCYIASTDNGTDITISDRQKEFVEGNKTIGQDDCDFEAYDDINKKAKCSCKPKESPFSITDMKIDNQNYMKILLILIILQIFN